MKDATQEMMLQTVKAAPAVAGAWASAMTLNEWVALSTGLYVIVQTLYLARKWWREEIVWARRTQEHTRRATDDFDGQEG